MFARINNSLLVIYLVFYFVFLYLVLLATAHSFADENTLACFRKNIQEQIASLEFECEVVLNWCTESKMVVNKVRP